MYTIGQLLENNLIGQQGRKKKTAQRKTRSSLQKNTRQNTQGWLDFSIDIDRQWQRMWALDSEESHQLDQIG